VRRADGLFDVRLEGADDVDVEGADVVLAATGRAPLTRRLGLEAAGVRVDEKVR
jgi:pyruvate/2-oxoglutarate dehydrogenase complex dihydrolipoamide dehydrogenase (E3) component